MKRNAGKLNKQQSVINAINKTEELHSVQVVGGEEWGDNHT